MTLTPKSVALAALLAMAAAGAHAVNFNALPQTPGPVPTDYYNQFSANDWFGQYTKTLQPNWTYNDVTFDFWWTGSPDPANVKFAMVSFGNIAFSDFKLYSCITNCNAPVGQPNPSMGVRVNNGNVWFEGLSTLPLGHYLFTFDVSNMNNSVMDLTTTVQITAVPEPGTWALMVAGLGVVGWAAKRRSERSGKRDAATSA